MSMDNSNGAKKKQPEELALAKDAVFRKSKQISSDDAAVVKGYDFNDGIQLDAIMNSYATTGFQATSLAKAIQIINEMISARGEPVIGEETFPYPVGKKRHSCTIFLGYTSNLVTSGLREVIRYLVEHNMVDCLVTSAGGVEEDLIKCLAPSYIGEFELDGATLRRDGLNRAGNILIPNNNYCLFEDWIMPIFDEFMERQANGHSWTPSKLIAELGVRINNPSSICYWAARNKIPIFCPALTDGSLGDMLYFHSVRNGGGIRLDIVEDLRHINTLSVKSQKSGMIILGGGLIKHHINNANLMRNGADYTVYVNTGQEFDGSDSGARPDEAVSWGKIKCDAHSVKVFADASLVFPLIVAQTFAKTRGKTEDEGNCTQAIH